MVRPRRFVRALVARTGTTAAGAALCLPLALGLGAPVSAAPAGSVASAGPPQQQAPRAASAPAPDTAPLRVRIATMSRATLPARGTLRIRGTVTNRSEETWTTINLYATVGDDLAPMTTSADLAAAMEVPFEAAVGERLIDVGVPGTIESLAPGETASYAVTVPVDELGFAEDPQPGVYWFGVHALGQGGVLPRDDVADGRARTFLPYVPRRTDAVPATLVVPLTHAVLHDDAGALAEEDRWTQRLSPGGRLRDLLALGEQAADRDIPLTWLVDPALLDAVGRLARGNPGRSLAPTPGPDADEPGDGSDGSGAGSGDGSVDGDPAGGATPDPSASGTPEPSPTGEPEPGATPDTPAAIAARGWLDLAAEVFAAGDVATLPYGNPDLAATQLADPGLLDLALAQQSTVLESLGIDARPVAAHPQGYVDATTAVAAPDDRPLLVADRFLLDPGTSHGRLAGQQVIVTSAGAEQGSPGPGRSLTAVGLRQRLLAEAAVRALPAADPLPVTDPGTDDAGGGAGGAGGLGSITVDAAGGGSPLVAVLPTDWDLTGAEELLDGLDPGWVDLGSLDAVTSGTTATELGSDDLVDPDGTGGQLRAMEPATFEAVRDLIDAGDTLQRILVDNTQVGARVTEEALSALSYSVRRQQGVARGSLALSRSWLDARLGAVGVAASSGGVTLSGDSGSFVVTLTNDLDETVRVGITSVSDEELDISPVAPLDLGPRSRTSVVLEVATSSSRVHSVTLMVTDADGVPLGATDQLPIRSVLVSDVIWVIIGVAVGILFVTIGLRLRRRILAARRSAPATV